MAEDLSLPDWGIVKAETLAVPNSILVYGPPGKGKTVFAGSIVDVPGYERVLVLDTEGSTVSLGPWYPEVDVIKTPTAERFKEVAEALLSGKIVEPESGLPYQAVIIDTLDKAQERQLDLFAKSPDAKTKNGEENTFFKWAAIKSWTSRIGDLFHQAPFLTIFVMHQDQEKSESGVVTTTVMLQGKSQQVFPSVPDIIAYFNIITVEDGGKKTKERAADFRASDKLIAKQRFADKLDGIILDPTFEKVFRKIEPQRFSN